MSAEILDAERVFEGWSSLSRLRLRLADGAEVERLVEDHGTAVAVLPYDPKRRTLMLLRQPRAPVVLAGEDDILEIAAGQLEGADPAACARREAMEELGLALGALEPLGCFWVMPGLSTERLHLFLAVYAPGDRTGPGGGAPGEHENITVVETPAAEVWRLAQAGRLPDMKTLLAVHALRARRPEAFED